MLLYPGNHPVVFFAWVPVSTLAVSALYVRLAPKGASVWRQVLSCGHGCTVTLAYVFMISVLLIGHGESSFFAAHGWRLMWALVGVCAFALLLIITGFFAWRGPKPLHLLQAVNFGALYFTMVVGLEGMVARWT